MDALSIILWIVSIAFTIFISKWFSSRKKLLLIIDNEVFSFKRYSSIKDLRITYNDTEISVLCITSVTIKNKGNRIIDGNDIAEHDKLRIEITEPTNFFQYSIINANNGNNVKLKKAGSQKYIVDFDYIDKKEEIIIKFYYDYETPCLCVNGKIKGCKIVFDKLSVPKPTSSFFSRILDAIGLEDANKNEK